MKKNNLTNIEKYGAPTVGCHVDASSESADYCNEQTIEFAEQFGFTFEGERDDDDDSQTLSELGDCAVDYLNELESRSFLSWTFEENSLFLAANVDGAREDCEFVSSKEQDCPPDDYRGEWLHVSDHDNATLYVRDEAGKDTEIWSVV